MTDTVLIEPSFADALAAINAAPGLSAAKRSHWACSLRQIAQAMDKPIELIPARWTSVRHPIGRLHHVRVGSTAKTLANHKSNVRAALFWFAQEKEFSARGAPFTTDWAALWERLPGRRSTRANLSGLMRYCSARGVNPPAVGEHVIDDYMLYRAETTALATDSAARRAIARTWNACVDMIAGWPSQRLIEPAVEDTQRLAWEVFSAGLRADVERYLAGLTKIRRGANGKRIRPCTPSSIKTRRAELVAFARMAVRQGVPIESLASLGALLDPAVVERVIEAYWKADGPEPRTYTIKLGAMLLGVARNTRCLGENALEQLKDIRAYLETYRRGGLTDKNLGVIRQVLTGDVWTEVVNLPAVLTGRARTLRDHAPIKAAVTAQIAVAIAILTVAPIRLGNLIRIRLDENLIKPGGLNSSYWLVFPHYDVKNRVQLEFPFDPTLTALIDEYIHEFRSSLLRGSNDLWLFPGESGGFKDAKTFSGQVSERIRKGTGLRLTVHQFRHAAAAILLKHRPGEYELVRRVLGHRNIQTTIRYYCGLETTQANVIFGDIVRKQMKFDEDGSYGANCIGRP